uniref:Alpha-carbonic anhydrase domain-containing protein n=1 Tax=Vespula pensylvanica TaxID=30213 RepID=A0A834P6I6_VESPE|nr:hypothetical protein H0235_006392 [Vespula pensylvanica]
MGPLSVGTRTLAANSVGPSFWGLINPQWSLCSKGRRQSPINIEPDKLLFDPHLRPVHVDKHKVLQACGAYSIKPQENERILFVYTVDD